MIPLSDNTSNRRFPFITIGLIAVNFYVFFWWQIRIGLEESVMVAGFFPRDFTRHVPDGPIHLFTAMFMHGGLMHLLGSMWFLWVFGNTVESDTGAMRFLVFFLVTGAIATLAHTASEPFSRMPLVGASGAISSVLGAYLVKHPGATIRTLIPLGIFSTIIEVLAFVFLLIWIGIQFLSASATRGHHGGGVAYLAHISGFVAGAVLIIFFQSKERKMRAPGGLRRRGISTSDARRRD